jgi:hypothetical protein
LKLHLNFVVIETFARLDAALAFLGMMNDAIPTMADKEHQYLEALASAGRWEYCEFDAERDALHQRFDSWIPTVAAYSAVVFLHSIIETQLEALAECVGNRQGSRFLVKDMHGSAVERSAIFLERVLSINVKKDPAWSCLKDLQTLRNIIVHRGGKPGESDDERKKVGELVSRYPPALELRKVDGFHEQVWMSMNLCRDFAQKGYGFFERVFKACGLPNRHLQLDSENG